MFRYPGSKAKLALNPFFRALMDPLMEQSPCFYEGFLGSAAVTLDLALRFPTKQFVVTDKDENIAAFWQLVASGTPEEAEEFEQRILDFATMGDKVGYFKTLRASEAVTLVDRAYKALFFNRTTFSGIAMAQPIGGFNQVSEWTIDCRYNAGLLVTKFQGLRALFENRLTVTQEDCFDWLQRIPPNAPLYLDPPYYVKGDDLYPTSMTSFEHGRLADVLKNRTNWVMSYDICETITNLYGFAKLLKVPFRYSINGAKDQWKADNEYLIVSPEVDATAFEITS
jgi:DNA adenine methylase